jgi:hypothetical protein
MDFPDLHPEVPTRQVKDRGTARRRSRFIHEAAGPLFNRISIMEWVTNRIQGVTKGIEDSEFGELRS